MDLEDQTQSEVFIAHVSYVNAHQRASTMEETKPSKQRDSASSHQPAAVKDPPSAGTMAVGERPVTGPPAWTPTH